MLRPAIVAALTLLLAAPGAASAREPLETILQDDAQLLHRPEAEVRTSVGRLKALGVDRLRVTVNWSVVTRDAGSTTRPEFDAADPAAYEQGRWRGVDQVVRLADEAGLKVMLDVAFYAPRWASADPEGERGRTEIDPAAFGAFATAVARRYSGSFAPPVDPRPVAPNEDEQLLDEFFGGSPAREREPEPEPAPAARPPLPRVDVLTLWNEPNHTGFLRPQWVKEPSGAFVARSPQIYRAMIAAAYPAIKAAAPGTTVLVGGTSGSGAYRNKGTGGVPPLRFLRELACVDERFRPLRTAACAGFAGVPGDGWSHHPYSMKATPDARSSARQVDDVPIAELPRLASTLRRLARDGRISERMRSIWLTEYGYETNPPSTISRFGALEQARFLAWGEHLAWSVPSVRSFAQFLLRDLPPGAVRTGASIRRPFGEWFSGLEFPDGRAKPALEAFRAGIFVRRRARGLVQVWGRLRMGAEPQTVVVEVARRPGAAWRPVRTSAFGAKRGAASFGVAGAGAFDRLARASSTARFRMRLADGRLSPEVPVVARPRAPRR